MGITHIVEGKGLNVGVPQAFVHNLIENIGKTAPVLARAPAADGRASHLRLQGEGLGTEDGPPKGIRLDMIVKEPGSQPDGGPSRSGGIPGDTHSRHDTGLGGIVEPGFAGVDLCVVGDGRVVQRIPQVG